MSDGTYQLGYAIAEHVFPGQPWDGDAAWLNRKRCLAAAEAVVAQLGDWQAKDAHAWKVRALTAESYLDKERDENKALRVEVADLKRALKEATR